MEKLTTAELKLMQIIWEADLIGSGELVKEAASRLEWKKSTTYTILKKLIEKGVAVNEDSVISPTVSNSEYYDSRRSMALDTYFSGSLPEFVLAFCRERKLSRIEIDELEKMIAEYKEELDD